MKFLKIFLIISIVFLTVVTGLTSPKLHKTFVIKGSDFKLERYSEKLTQKELKLLSQKPKRVPRPVKIEPSAFLTDEKAVINPSNSASEEKIIVQPSYTASQEKMIVSETNPNEEIVSQIPKAIQAQMGEFLEQSTEETTPDRKLTRREELIAWNKWRSDIMNEVMMTSGVDAPVGTAFYFSFKVDKYKNITGIKTFCTNPRYSTEKEKVVAAIRQLPRTQLLTFPKGSVRNSTTMRGLFLIGLETNLANPEDYNDLERINVYE